MGTTMLLSVGGVTKRPVVVGDTIEIRLTAYLAFQVDTRVLNAKKALRAFRRFRRWIESPEELDMNEERSNDEAGTVVL
jgi:pyruvate/2-oxoglutarate dehydrogenase complex dihydrolipoamide acyltransferase (E2) component